MFGAKSSVKGLSEKHNSTICKRVHPTCLHQDQKDVNALKTYNTNNSTAGTSMIMPVWLSSEERPGEVLTYAMLDTQSDTTFLLEETACSLGVKGDDVCLSLSTMTAPKTRIKSRRVSNIKVRAFGDSKASPIKIPTAYTRDFIPANRSHIPVSETIMKWPHLKELQHQLPALQSCEVGLLIGYNCPEALAPL